MVSRTSVTASHTQRLIGISLLVTVAALLLLKSVCVDTLTTGALSIALLAITASGLFAAARTDHGLTSLIGLFMITTAIFNLGRPLLWLFTQDDRVYDLTFGLTISTPDSAKSEVLLFWCVGLASFLGGYFCRFRLIGPALRQLPRVQENFLRCSFWVTLSLISVAIPLALMTKVAAFAEGGYTALYANQTNYTFSWLRALDFLLPALFAMAVLLRKPLFIRCVFLAIVSTSIVGLLVGQRAAAGQWIIVALWYVATIRGKHLNRVLLCGAAVSVILFFQFIAGWREGYDSSLSLSQFMVEQGVTFLLPQLALNFDSPPLHTIVASFLPLGGVYSAAGIGTAQDMSVGSYLSSGLNPDQFSQGYGLGGTFYVEIFLACGGIWLLFGLATALGGLLLRKWEESGSSSNLSRFYLCTCFSSIVFLPRGTISAVTSQLIYVTGYMLLMFIMNIVVRNLRPTETVSDSIAF